MRRSVKAAAGAAMLALLKKRPEIGDDEVLSGRVRAE